MLTSYIAAAMRRAHYELLSDGTFYGEIPGFQGVYANEDTLEACREVLQEVLGGWLSACVWVKRCLPWTASSLPFTKKLCRMS